MKRRSHKILQGDCRKVLQKISGVDSVVTDPPYGLEFMAKGWDKGVPGVEFWEAIQDAMKPGSYLLAFGGTRTHHRLMCAIEDAGFEIRDCIMWVYGTGFPKSHNLKDDRQGWGTALKPAWEPVIVARKPFKGTVAGNVLEYGTGAINVEGCRVGTTDDLNGGSYSGGGAPAPLAFGVKKPAAGGFVQPRGRWPANLIHDGSEEVLGLFPQHKTRPAKDAISGKGSGAGLARDPSSYASDGIARVDYLDSGSAARFFYCAKASKAEREEGLHANEAEIVNDGRKTSIGNPYQRGDTLRKNTHPTVKPLALMRYLCRLVTPPGGVVLDPFAGSGSTLVAAKAEGFNSLGIELEQKYCDIAAGRVRAARGG